MGADALRPRAPAADPRRGCDARPGSSRRPDHRIRHGRRDLRRRARAFGREDPHSRARRAARGQRRYARRARDLSSAASSGPTRSWLDGAGRPFNPGNYYYVGGNTKLYGAVLIRYRAQDFDPIVHRDGTTPGWPFAYDELEPWYTARREALPGARRPRLRPHRAAAFDALSFRPRAGRTGDRKGPRAPETRRPHPFPLPLGIDIDKWLRRAKTPWDAFPDAGHGKMDAESCGVAEALAHPNVELRTNARVERLLMEPDGQRIAGVEVVRDGERSTIAAGLVVLAAGAVNSAALLLRSAEDGVANRSDAVGRHFMNHNASAVLAIDPRVVNDSVYQKTLGHQRFLSRRRARRAAARQHPAARPRHRADPEVQPAAGRPNGRFAR